MNSEIVSRAVSKHRASAKAFIGTPLAAGVVVSLTLASVAATIHESETEFLAAGDFNGDGKADAAIVDRYTGRVRIGYQLAPGMFDWVNWRASGVKDVSAVSVGKLTDTQRDSLAISSADLNLITVLDAANPALAAPPVTVPSTVLGPNVVLAVDIGGPGNTPLHDLFITSIYNTDPENRITYLRNDGTTFTQLSETAAPGTGARVNRVSLRRGGREYAAGIVEDTEGVRLLVGSLESGSAQTILSIGNVPKGADYVVGHFRGGDWKEIVIYEPGGTTLKAYPLTESGGQPQAETPRTITLPKPVKQLAVVESAAKSRLLAVYGPNDPAELLEFEAERPPVSLQALPGATNRFLNAALVLPDTIILVSSLMEGRASAQYQVYRLAEGKAVPGPFGNLASLADTDDITVPDIHKRIVANLDAKSEAEMRNYTNTIPGTDVKFEMVAIQGGEFVMGSSVTEKEHQPDEAPQHKVKVSPFWMGQFEVTWNQYLLFMYADDEKKLREKFPTPGEINQVSDAVTRPSKPYVDMSFGMGKDGYPAIAMTQHGANKFCHWLSAKTGHFYRLPSEAEWEYACRAGTTTAYSFGNDPAQLPEYGWFFDNSNSKYQKIGKKKPNPWGLYDMHGNVLEWVLDQYDSDFYKAPGSNPRVDPWNKATQPYPHSARGGSWDDDPPALRSAARRGSDRTWKMQDPQLPKSIWYHSDAQFVGFRLVRPLKVPPPEEMVKYWTSGVEKD